MKAMRFFFAIGLIAVIASCSKQEIVEPENTAVPDLKAAGCTPSVWNYYDEDYSILIPIFPTGCFPEPIMVTTSSYITSGRVVTAASCRFNDKGEINWNMTGMGMFTMQPYTASIVNEYHFIGSITGQGAEVTHVLDEAVFTNQATGETYTATLIIKQTINGNGEVVIDEFSTVPCE
jgi:hypothetical protein